MKNLKIVSFGYLHGEAPAAHITLDLRHHFRDPHVSPELRHMTAFDNEVQRAVLTTDGIVPLIRATMAAVKAFREGPSGDTITVAVGCAGGRHRAATVAMLLGELTGGTVTHRDLDKPVVDRDSKGNRA